MSIASSCGLLAIGAFPSACASASPSTSTCATERELRSQPLLDRHEPELLEPLALGLRELLVCELAIGAPAPERQRPVGERERECGVPRCPRPEGLLKSARTVLRRAPRARVSRAYAPCRVAISIPPAAPCGAARRTPERASVRKQASHPEASTSSSTPHAPPSATRSAASSRACFSASPIARPRRRPRPGRAREPPPQPSRPLSSIAGGLEKSRAIPELSRRPAPSTSCRTHSWRTSPRAGRATSGAEAADIERSLPDGLILHAAGRTDEGFRIIEVWESEDA